MSISRCRFGRCGVLTFEFGDDLDASAGADARGACPEHRGGVGQGADAAGCFDSGSASGYAAQQGDVVCRSPAGGEAGAGLEEVGAGAEGELGGAELLFEGEEAGLEDDFYDSSGGVGEFDYTSDILAHGFVVTGLTGLEEADIHDHVDVVCALLEDADGFVAF